MSLDWLSLNPSYDRLLPVNGTTNLPFILLENESLAHITPNRVSLHLNPTKLANEIKRSKEGTVYLTNKRLIFISDNTYIPATSISRNQSLDFDNFVLLINRNIYGFQVVSSWFGSNKYQILFRPLMENAGLNHLYVWNGVLFFNNGGMVDFDAQFQKVYNEFKYSQDPNDQLPKYEE